MTPDTEPWRQIVARLFTLIRLPLQPHDPPKIPANTKWAIEQTWLAVDRGERLSLEGYLKLGNVSYGLGDLSRALQAYDLARDVNHDVEMSAAADSHRSLAAFNAGHALFQRGDFKRSLAYVQEAVSEWSARNESNDRLHLAEGLLLLGMIQKRLMQIQDSHDSLTKALVVSREMQQLSIEARCWVQFAHLDYADSHLAPAQEKIRKALDLLAVAGDHRESVRTYYNAALLSADAGDVATAQHQINRALELMSTHQIEYGNGKVESLRDELLAARRGQQV